jgi:hypothetical protein
MLLEHDQSTKGKLIQITICLPGDVIAFFGAHNAKFKRTQTVYSKQKFVFEAKIWDLPRKANRGKLHTRLTSTMQSTLIAIISIHNH